MNWKEIIPVTIGSTVLLAYCWLMFSGNESGLTSLLFSIFPFLLIWIAISILRYGKFEGTELDEQEEWGYSDKDKNDLGTF